MPQLQLSTGEVHYRDEGTGAPVLLLHANPGDSRDYAAVLPALAQRHRVIALDWPGYGGSALPSAPETRDALFFHGVLREFLQRLALPPCAIVGNSLGGNAAARLTLSDPQLVRALVLVSPGGFTPHNFVTRAFCRLQGSRWALPPRLWARLYLRRRTDVTAAMLERAGGEQSQPARLALNRAVWRSFARPKHDLRATAGAIRVPVLLMFGRYDPAIPAHKDGRVAARCLPRAELAVMPCGHAPFAELPEAFLARVQAFWDALPSAGGSGAPA